MSSSDGIDVAMVSSVRVGPRATRDAGSARAAETAERAGRFTAMLESLNGVSAAANDGAEAVASPNSARAAISSSDRPVALGAVSLLALNEIGLEGGGGTTTDMITASDTAVDARWLATLQNDAGGRDLAAD